MSACRIVVRPYSSDMRAGLESSSEIADKLAVLP